jgi:hypothetical protein
VRLWTQEEPFLFLVVYEFIVSVPPIAIVLLLVLVMVTIGGILFPFPAIMNIVKIHFWTYFITVVVKYLEYLEFRELLVSSDGNDND